MKSSAYVIEIEQAEKETKRTMLNTRHKIATQITTINQLTNNWNELEEWLKSVVEYETLHKGNYMTVRGEWGQEVLGKMEKIKEENK